LPIDLLNTDISTDTTLRPILFIRLQQRYCRATVKLKSVEIINTNTNNADGAYEISRNPILNGPDITWTKHPDPKSMIEYSYFTNPTSTGHTISNGYVSRAGYFSARSQIQDDLSVEELITAPSYCSDIYGNSDILSIACSSLTGTITIRANARWLEIY
jgi:hypothetical protein